jgi:hypothetical protein
MQPMARQPGHRAASLNAIRIRYPSLPLARKRVDWTHTALAGNGIELRHHPQSGSNCTFLRRSAWPPLVSGPGLFTASLIWP